MDWNRFEFVYRLAIDNPRLLITIEAYREAAFNLVLPPDWRDQLRRLNRVRAVHGTTALEGNPLSEEQVAEALDGGDNERGRTREQAQIRNAGNAQDWVRSRFGGDKAPLQLEDILEMHRLMTRHSEKPSKQVSFAELLTSSYVRFAYRSVTPRTFRRELVRLADRGFILFTVPEGGDQPIIELDFSAIGRS